MTELDLEGERFDMELNLLVSNIKITKKAKVQRLDDKVAIVIPCDNKQDAENLVTSIGAKVI
jgi:hypothetical protein